MTTHSIRIRIAAYAMAFSLALPALAMAAPDVAVAPQYDTTHVYVQNADIDAFVTSFVNTFGGKASPRAVFTVTPNVLTKLVTKASMSAFCTYTWVVSYCGATATSGAAMASAGSARVKAMAYEAIRVRMECVVM